MSRYDRQRRQHHGVDTETRLRGREQLHDVATKQRHLPLWQGWAVECRRCGLTDTVDESGQHKGRLVKLCRMGGEGPS